MKYKTIGTCYLRGSQYEIKYDILDDSGRIRVGGLTKPIGDRKLDEAELDKLFETVILPAFSEEPEEQEKTYLESEIATILIKKGYLLPGQTIKDLEINEIVADEVSK